MHVIIYIALSAVALFENNSSLKAHSNRTKYTRIELKTKFSLNRKGNVSSIINCVYTSAHLFSHRLSLTRLKPKMVGT